MSRFIKIFIGYILFCIIVIVTSVVLIKDTNILLSVILLEIIILLLGLFYIQMVFVGVRQQFTTDRMTKTIKAEKIGTLSYTDLDSDYKREKFSLSIIDDVHIYHKIFDVAVKPVLKKPFLISHLWLENPVSIEQVIDYHQHYSLDNYQKTKLKVAVLVTFMKDNTKNNNFIKSIIYDNTKKMNYYHIPVLISKEKVYLYDALDYSINEQLSNIIQHLNNTIKEKKLEF